MFWLQAHGRYGTLRTNERLLDRINFSSPHTFSPMSEAHFDLTFVLFNELAPPEAGCFAFTLSRNPFATSKQLLGGPGFHCHSIHCNRVECLARDI